MQTFRVLISGASDQWVRSIKAGFQEKAYFSVVDTDESQDIITQINSTQPEVVVLLIDNEAARENLEALSQHCRHMNLVLVVEDPNQIDLFSCMQKRVSGCLPVRLLPRQVVDAVELIVLGGIVCMPRLNSEYFRRFFNNLNPIPDGLTLREREILKLIHQNYSNKEIAATLCLSESTVKTHLRNIFKKMGVRGRSEVLTTLVEHSLQWAKENVPILYKNDH